MLTDSELFVSAYISFAFLHEAKYGRFPPFPMYTRIECLEKRGEIALIRTIELSHNQIELKDELNSFNIKSVGPIQKHYFKVRHFERDTELIFETHTGNPYKVIERGHEYTSELFDPKQSWIQELSATRARYNFKFDV